MGLGLSEKKDGTGGHRYIEKQRISQTIRNNMRSGKLNQIFRDVINGPTQETMYDLGPKEEIYYGATAQYMGQYLWKIEDYVPKNEARLRDMFR